MGVTSGQLIGKAPIKEGGCFFYKVRAGGTDAPEPLGKYFA